MRYLTASLLLLLPVAASAESLPDSFLKEQNSECIATCNEQRGFSFCADMCGCITRETDTYMSAADVRERVDRLRRDPEDTRVRGQLDRIAHYCATRAASR